MKNYDYTSLFFVHRKVFVYFISYLGELEFIPLFCSSDFVREVDLYLQGPYLVVSLGSIFPYQ